MIRQTLGAVLVGLVWLGVAAAPADAHSVLVHAIPADGSTQSSAPTSLTLSFDEEVLLDSTTVSLRSAAGLLPTISGARAASGAQGADRATEVIVPLPSLPRGTYRVAWQIRSAADLHRSAGVVVFGVGDTVLPAAQDRSGQAPRPIDVTLQWLRLVVLGLLVGAALHAGWVVPRSRLPDSLATAWQGRLWTAVGAAAALAAAIGLGVLVRASAGVGHLEDVWASGYVRFWIVGETAYLVIALVVASALARGWSGPRAAVGVAAVLAALVSLAGSGHIGSPGGRLASVGLLTLHLAAGAGWGGGVLVLVIVGPAVLRQAGQAHARAMFRAFGPPAAVGLGVVVATGVALTGRQVASADALLTTTYGRVLVVKVVLAGLAGLVGLHAHRALRRSTPMSLERLIPMIRAEVAVLAAVLVAAAALAAGTPARGPAFAPTVATTQGRLAAQQADLFETVDLAPNAVGQSWLRVSVDQTRRPEPAPITGVSAILVSPSGVAQPQRDLTSSAIPGRWELPGVDITAAGTWDARIVVRRAGRPDVEWRTAWVVPGGPLGDRRPVVSDWPWSTALDGLAAVSALAGLAGWFVGLRRPAGGRRPAPRATDLERAGV